MAEVRLADCHRLGHEVHLTPGAGDVDWVDMFRRVEGKETNAFGTLDDMLQERDFLAAKAKEAGVA